ncbi:MAG: hypothetical protein WDO17_13745 [Alphaproteobacteria bacterium]
MTIKNRMIAFGVAGALAIGAAATAAAGPLPVNSINGPTHATDVAWRGHGWGGRGWGPGVGIGAGIAAGALIGSAVAAQPYGAYYGEPGYAYAQPYAYDAGPTYYRSYGYRNWGYGPCFTDEGYGRRTPCDTTGQR